MKKQLLYLLLSQRNSMSKSLKKKLLIFGGVLGAIVLVIGVGMIYLGVQAASYLFSQAPTHEQISRLQDKATELTNQGTVILKQNLNRSCVDEVLSHLNFDVWLNRPFVENTSRITTACWPAPGSDVQESNETPPPADA